MKKPHLFIFTVATSLILSMNLAFAATAAAEKATKKWTIAMIPKGTTQSFWKYVHAGAEKAAQEENVELLWNGPQKDDDRQAQIQIVQNMISRKVDAIALIPQDSRALVPVVKAAKGKKIPVVLVNSGLDGNDFESFVATNNHGAGKMGADKLAEILNKKGKVCVLRFFEGSQSTTERENGFIETIQKDYPQMQVLEPNQYAGVGIQKSFQAAQNILNRHPDLNGFFCTAESVCTGILQALRMAKKTNQVKFVGFDSSEPMKEALKKGEAQALVVQSPFSQGYLGLKKTVAFLRGETIPKRVETGVVVVTPENLNDPTLQEEYINPDLKKWLKE